MYARDYKPRGTKIKIKKVSLAECQKLQLMKPMILQSQNGTTPSTKAPQAQPITKSSLWTKMELLPKPAVISGLCRDNISTNLKRVLILMRNCHQTFTAQSLPKYSRIL